MMSLIESMDVNTFRGSIMQASKERVQRMTSILKNLSFSLSVFNFSVEYQVHAFARVSTHSLKYCTE